MIEMPNLFEKLAGDPIYQPLWPLLAALGRHSALPDAAALNRLRDAFDAKPVSLRGAPIEFAPATTHLSAKEYESSIYHSGRVSTREQNWHDLFNALVWLRFGKFKAALNALHCSGDDTLQRSPRRDFATLLDESGVLIACDDIKYADLLRQRHWHTLFWSCRNEIASHMRFFVVGHALYEKARAPYSGMTAKALLITVPGSFMGLEIDQAIAEIDRQAAALILQHTGMTNSTKNLLPLPILGIPGWGAAQSAAFYLDTRYFRP